MSVKIRLSRQGRKKRAIYDIVVADARSPRDGKFIEKIGQYNPNSTPAGVELKSERALHWLMVGAEPTDTTRKILSVKGIMLQKHLQVGVVKGAITQEAADAKFNAWLSEKETLRDERLSKLQSDKVAGKKAVLEAERKKKEDAIAKKQQAEQELIAAAEAAANPPAPVTEEAETATEEATEVTETATEEATEVAETIVENEVSAEGDAPEETTEA